MRARAWQQQLKALTLEIEDIVGFQKGFGLCFV